jgi:hypothetical protein
MGDSFITGVVFSLLRGRVSRSSSQFQKFEIREPLAKQAFGCGFPLSPRRGGSRAGLREVGLA